MDSVLIVSGATNSANMISDMINAELRHNITIVSNASGAKRLLNQKEYSLIIVNSPLTDELGTEFSIEAVNKTMAGVIIMAKSDMSTLIRNQIYEYGIMLVEKPINKRLFLDTLRIVKTTSQRLKAFQKENLMLKNQINEIRLVERAKACLMRQLNISEPESHKFIVKQSMALRISKREVAQDILNTYEK